MAKKSKSVLKRARQSEKRRRRNLAVKSSVKSALKKATRTIAQQDLETAKAEVTKAVKLLDKAASKGVIHKNTAARKKSRLMKKLNLLQASQSKV